MPCSIEKVRKIVVTKIDMVDNLSKHLHLLRKVWQHCWTMPALEGILCHAFGASYLSLVRNSHVGVCKNIHSSKPCLQLVFVGEGRLQVCCCREWKWSSLENVYPTLTWVKQIGWKLDTLLLNLLNKQPCIQRPKTGRTTAFARCSTQHPAVWMTQT